MGAAIAAGVGAALSIVQQREQARQAAAQGQIAAKQTSLAALLNPDNPQVASFAGLPTAQGSGLSAGLGGALSGAQAFGAFKSANSSLFADDPTGGGSGSVFGQSDAQRVPQ
jgi:hypothetical protein